MSTAIVEVQTAVAEFDKVAAGLSALKEKYAGVVFEVTTGEGMGAAKEARATIREPRYEIEKVRKAAKAPILKLGKELDDRAKQITADILAIEEPIDQQIKNEEARKEREKEARAAAELARVTKHQDRITYLNGSPNLSSLDDPALIAEHISDLQAEVVDESMEEYRERADAAKATGIARLQALHAASVERVAEAARIKAERAELEKLRAEQAERDRIAQEAIKAERAEQERVAAAERARIAEEERLAKVARDAETARHNEQLRLQREEADRQARERQAAIDAENARVANELRIEREEQERIARERQAEWDRREAEQKAILEADAARVAAEEARRAEQARIAALIRPSDDEMIDVLAIHYNAPAERVVSWILTMDLSDRAAA